MKQILAIRQDINLSKGKFAQIITWATLFSAKKTKTTNPKKFKQWLRSGQKKISIKIKSLEELNRLREKIEINSNIIFTCVLNSKKFIETLPEDELLGLGIGPDHENILNPLTQHFKLY